MKSEDMISDVIKKCEQKHSLIKCLFHKDELLF